MELSSICSQDEAVALYFVLPPNCTPETCSKYLKCSFQACRDNAFGPVWLYTENCLKMKPVKQDVYIVDPFEGEAFNYLLCGAFKCVVLGPRCLLSCLHSKIPIPELPSPLHNMAMQNLVITSSGFDKEGKAELQKMVQMMSGIYSSNFHEAITHLVVKTVGSKKYMVAVEKDTPIMTGEWVKVVWKEANDENGEDVSATHEQFFKYTCPVFEGLVICVSQLPRIEKDALKELIEKNGGTYAANLEMSVTSVLITPSSEGEKYKHAYHWRIPCLTQEWIHDSVEHGHAVPMDEYKLVKRKSSTPTHEQSSVLPNVSVCSSIFSDSVWNNKVDETATSSEINNDASVKMTSVTDSKISEGLNKLEALDIHFALQAGLLFDGCKVFVSGFNAKLNEKLRRILNAGGATRFSTLTEAVSHIVIGKVVLDDLNIINGWITKPAVVTADWIVECVKQRRPAEETDFLYIKADSGFISPPIKLGMTKVSGKQATNFTAASVNETNNETLIDAELMSQYLGNKNKSENSQRSRSLVVNRDTLDCSSLPDSQQTQTEGIFKSKIFTVSGFSGEIEEQLVELITVNGGEVASENVPNPVHYSVISIDGDGRPHPATANYVTHLFIEDCLEQEMLVQVEYFHLPFVWPQQLSVLDGCVVATSIYNGRERLFLIHMATRLGALYQEMFAKRANPGRGMKCSTHLLCPSPAGDKYNAAIKWGIPVVSCDWLLKCAEEGERITEDSFRVEQAAQVKADRITVLLKLLSAKIELSKASIGNRIINKHTPSCEAGSAMLGATPVNKSLRDLKNLNLADIKTPDTETLRRLYPTPGCSVKNDSLDNMPTPETPYGSTWFQNPSSRIRKGIKRALDALPDDNMTRRKPFESLGTPEEVYYERFTNKLKKIVNDHPVYKLLQNKEVSESTASKVEIEENVCQDEETAPATAADVHGPLTGVIVYASRKLADMQQDLYQTVQMLGGDYRWTYDKKVTHFIHTGRLNDTNKEFRLAKEDCKAIVAPDWVWMCRDENHHVNEALFPHTHNPKMTLPMLTTLRASTKKKKKKEKDSQTEKDKSEEEVTEESFSDEDEKTRESLSKQLEELEAITGAQQGRRSSSNSSARNRSVSDKLKSTPTRPLPQSYPKTGSNAETESQNTAITWDDPQEREARAKLQGALVGSTQDIIAKKMETLNVQQNNFEDFSDPKEVTLDVENAAAMQSPHRTVSFDTSNYCFVLSGMTDEEKGQYTDIIICLGGRMCENQQSFDSSATHIITLKPSRSEKHLAAIASGKWILYKSFLDASQARGQFVQEEDHEWGNEKASSLPQFKCDSIESKLAFAAHRWRMKVSETKNGAFHGMSVVFYASMERVSAYKRLVEAGQGDVVSISEDLSNVTHCFVEQNKADRVDLATFAARQVPCLSPVFLNALLVNFPPPDEMESCIPEYKQIISDMTVSQNNFSIRRKKKLC